MRKKLTLGALVTAGVFAALPAIAQTSGQKSQSQPGMCMPMSSKPGERQSSAMCACCQGMAGMQHGQKRRAPRRQ